MWLTFFPYGKNDTFTFFFTQRENTVHVGLLYTIYYFVADGGNAHNFGEHSVKVTLIVIAIVDPSVQ